MQMQALKAHRYGNARRQAGDTFEVRATDVRLVKALGWAIEAPPPEAPAPAASPAKRTYTRKIVQAEATVAAPAHDPADRTYLRRDLVAEGE